MARYSAGARSAGAGSTTLPVGSIYSAASAPRGKLVEVHAINTTAVAVALSLVRLASAGTQGSGLVESKHNPDSVAASCTCVNTHTSTGPTLGDDLGFRTVLGAAVGSAYIWTFGGQENGIEIAVGTANGIGIIVATGTGQVIDFTFVWDE